jgi:hypothetical protein
MVSSTRLKNHQAAIKYTPEKSFQQFADEVSDAGRAGDVDTSKDLIAEIMKLFSNSAYGKTVTNKEMFDSTTYGNEDNISKKINKPHFKDLELLPYGQKYEVISTKRTIVMDLPLQIGVAVYHLAKLRNNTDHSNGCWIFIKISLINELSEMDTHSNDFAFSEDHIKKLIRPLLIKVSLAYSK